MPKGRQTLEELLLTDPVSHRNAIDACSVNSKLPAHRHSLRQAGRHSIKLTSTRRLSTRQPNRQTLHSSTRRFCSDNRDQLYQ